MNEVVYFRLFDLGGSIDLDEIRRRAPRDFLSGRVPTDRAAPKYAQFPEPLLVTVDRRTLETNLGALTVDLAVRPRGRLPHDHAPHALRRPATPGPHVLRRREDR